MAMPVAHCTSGSTMSAATSWWFSAVRFQRDGGRHRRVARRLPCAGQPPVGAGHRVAGAQQRRVGVAEEGDVGHRQRAERLAVVAAGEAEEAVLAGLAAVAPVVETHLQCDFHRRGAVGGVEAVAEFVAGQGRELL